MCRWSTALYTCGHRSPPVRVEEESCEDSLSCLYDGSDAVFKVSYQCRLCDPWEGPPSPQRQPAAAVEVAVTATPRPTTATKSKQRSITILSPPRRRRGLGKAIKRGFRKTRMCICQTK
ncbi:hypothetical protein I7I48_00844 [Histoplasma ohiense]|nr:hypothetical protein I7I48_00844 [Histoplasma ohiense (nom. inval.)]